ncbi:MAG TPA: YceI family protein [Candidatus Paceibacterota bacterium]
MTKIISTIIVLGVIVFIVFAVANKNKNPDIKTDMVDQTEVTATSSVNIPDGTYIASSTDAKINWTGRKVILKNWVDKGTIDLKEGSLIVENGAIVSNRFVIDMTTIKPLTTGMGGNQDRLATHLKSDDFFDAAKYPVSTFIAKEFTASTSNAYIVKGDLTIKGITKEISIPITFDYSDPAFVLARGSVDIDRTLWDVRYGSEKFFRSLGDNVIDDKFNLAFDVKLRAKAE